MNNLLKEVIFIGTGLLIGSIIMKTYNDLNREEDVPEEVLDKLDEETLEKIETIKRDCKKKILVNSMIRLGFTLLPIFLTDRLCGRYKKNKLVITYIYRVS